MEPKTNRILIRWASLPVAAASLLMLAAPPGCEVVDPSGRRWRIDPAGPPPEHAFPCGEDFGPNYVPVDSDGDGDCDHLLDKRTHRTYRLSPSASLAHSSDPSLIDFSGELPDDGKFPSVDGTAEELLARAGLAASKSPVPGMEFLADLNAEFSKFSLSEVDMTFGWSGAFGLPDPSDFGVFRSIHMVPATRNGPAYLHVRVVGGPVEVARYLAGAGFRQGSVETDAGWFSFEGTREGKEIVVGFGSVHFSIPHHD